MRTNLLKMCAHCLILSGNKEEAMYALGCIDLSLLDKVGTIYSRSIGRDVHDLSDKQKSVIKYWLRIDCIFESETMAHITNQQQIITHRSPHGETPIGPETQVDGYE